MRKEYYHIIRAEAGSSIGGYTTARYKLVKGRLKFIECDEENMGNAGNSVVRYLGELTIEEAQGILDDEVELMRDMGGGNITTHADLFNAKLILEQ